VRGVQNAISRTPICTGFAKFDPWQSLPVEQRTIEAGDVEAFRQAFPTDPVDDPVAA